MVGCMRVIICVSPVLQLDYTLVQLVVGDLSEGLVSSLLLILLLMKILHVNIRIVRGVHLGIRLKYWIGWFLWLRCDITDTAHAALEANVVHLVDWLARLLHDTQVTVLVHRCYLALEAIHEIRRGCRLPCALVYLI